MYTSQEIFNSALGIFSGTSSNAFANKSQLLFDAVRAVSSEVTVVEGKRVLPLSPVLVEGDMLYVEPGDVDRPIGLIPYGGKTLGNVLNDFDFTASSVIDDTLYGTQFEREYRMGFPLLRVKASNLSKKPIFLNTFSSLTTDGVATVTGDATGLTTNDTWFVDGNASLDFNVVQSSGTSSLVMTGVKSKDILGLDVDSIFHLHIDIPKEWAGMADIAGGLTSVQIRIGNNASNYYQMTTNTNSYGGAFIQGANTLSFKKRSATTVGTVSDDNITYIEIIFNHTASATGVKVDSLFVAEGFGMSYYYYSNSYFIDTNTGALLTVPNSNLTDKTVFNKDTYDLVVWELRKVMDFALKGDGSGVVTREAKRVLYGLQGVANEEGLYVKYRRKYPSDIQPRMTSY